MMPKYDKRICVIHPEDLDKPLSGGDNPIVERCITIRELINLIDAERYQMRQDEIRQIGWKGAQGNV